MDWEIGIEDARKKLGDVVDEVNQTGRAAYLTRRSRRVAAIVPTGKVPTVAQRHATVSDLPGWDMAETVLGISGTPGAWAWVSLAEGSHQPLGRDAAGRLYAFTGAALLNDSPARQSLDDGAHALLLGVDDGLALWVPPGAYRRIALIDPDEGTSQPDVRAWVPFREVRGQIPAAIPVEDGTA